MNTRTIGTCGHCGGPVTVPLIFWSVVPPTPRCEWCGRVPEQVFGPVLPMQVQEPIEQRTPRRRWRWWSSL